MESTLRLPHYSTIFNESQAEAVMSLGNSTEGYCNPDSPPRPVEFAVDISEILPESDELPEILSPAAGHIQDVFTSTDNSDSVSSVLTPNGQRTTRPHYFSTPIAAASVFGLCTTPFLFALKHTWETHTASPFIFISVVAYVMAFLDLCISFWIHKRLDNTNSPRQNLYLGWYRILEIVYYILCVIAFVLALAEVLRTLHQPQTTPPPFTLTPPSPPPV